MTRQLSLQGAELDELLALPIDRLRQRLEALGEQESVPVKPIGSQEVWAAGVTYQRSREARVAETRHADPYQRVYDAERPELFFKATAGRVRGPGEPIGIRSDSGWDVPEPELALVLNSRLEIAGYTIGNDVSSRRIEGENPLYLPQAKVYEGCCALGPWIVPAWELDPYAVEIRLRIRRGGSTAFEAETSTGRLHRRLDELAAWLGRGNRFPSGALLLTGTGIVPPDDFTLTSGDEVTVAIDGIGELTNPVEVVEAGAPAQR
jgi:2-dehydro-3-deoxy-D-arabinonate dehydratase